MQWRYSLYIRFYSGLAFHPSQPLLAASLHNGSVQLWNYRMGVLVDRFDEHEGAHWFLRIAFDYDRCAGPVRAVNFHPSRPLLATGGDDYKIKVWGKHPYSSPGLSLNLYSDIRPQNRRCLYTLHGHLDYVRTVQFHHEMPWIVGSPPSLTKNLSNLPSRYLLPMIKQSESGIAHLETVSPFLLAIPTMSCLHCFTQKKIL